MTTNLSGAAENPRKSIGSVHHAAPARIVHPDEDIELAGLHHVSEDEAGFTRRRVGKGFSYRRPDHTRLSAPHHLRRIRSLAIPPAWEKVWICRFANGHIQATGRDTKGRKQYVYHPEFRQLRERHKYDELLAFARTLPIIRVQVDEHLRLPGLPRDKVLATIVHLLDTTFIRVGNDEYARNNKSYGLTTLKGRHVSVDGSEISFDFKGKHGVRWTVNQRDRRIARVIRSCQELPGQHLFQYFDDVGERARVTSSDVNAYLREIAGIDITAKDFRTWGGTVLAAAELSLMPATGSKQQSARNIRLAVAAVAERLGNTHRICRQCYIHPLVFQAYMAGELEMPEDHRKWLSAAELTVLGLLEAGAT